MSQLFDTLAALFLPFSHTPMSRALEQVQVEAEKGTRAVVEQSSSLSIELSKLQETLRR